MRHTNEPILDAYCYALGRYALGCDGRAGVAIISGDACGFEYLSGEPLSVADVQDTINAYLDGEEQYDTLSPERIALLREEATDDEIIAAIHAVHVESYQAYCEWRWGAPESLP